MYHLVEIWKEQTGSRPSLSTPESGPKRGAFLAFCEAVVAPIYAANGLKLPSLGTLAKSVIYGRCKRCGAEAWEPCPEEASGDCGRRGGASSPSEK